jgi:hypothetical protein
MFGDEQYLDMFIDLYMSVMKYLQVSPGAGGGVYERGRYGNTEVWRYGGARYGGCRQGQVEAMRAGAGA